MKRNSLFLGLIIGLIAPLIAHLIMLFTSLRIVIGTKPLSIYVIAALINLLLVRFYYRNMLDRSARGVILITFVAMLLLIFTEKLSLT